MRSRRISTAVVCALVALASPAVAQAQDLFGTVGPGFTITLRDAQNRDVTQLDPGTYRITVEDRSDFHNFHLSGPGGVNQATEVEGLGTFVWEVTLVEGFYTFVCDPHRVEMRGRVRVGNPPPPPAPPPRLVATVGPGFTITFTANGRRLRSIAAGTYTMLVRDRSRFHNFHLRGPGLNRRTVVARTGTVTWRVRLRAGTYRFVCDSHARRMRGSFTVRG